MVDWKKDISFRKKEAEEAPPAEVAADAPKQSFWKKEISLGEKSASADAVAAEPVPVAEPTASKESFRQ